MVYVPTGLRLSDPMALARRHFFPAGSWPSSRVSVSFTSINTSNVKCHKEVFGAFGLPWSRIGEVQDLRAASTDGLRSSQKGAPEKSCILAGIVDDGHRLPAAVDAEEVYAKPPL